MSSDGNQVFAAFQVTLDPSSTREARHNAESYLERLKSAPSGLMNIYTVVQNAHVHCSDLESAEVYTQLALSILDDWMKMHWNTLSDPDQQKVRNDVLALLLNPPPTLVQSNSKALRSKLAVILCNVAERTFPQQWPTLLEDLVSNVWLNAAATHSQREVCIDTLEYLVTDCVDSDFNSALPAVRRQDILTGMRVHLETLLQTAYDYQMECCRHYVSTIAAASPGTGEESVRVAFMVNATTRLVDRLTQCSKVEEVFTDQHDFSAITVSMMSVPGLQLEASNFLYTIVCQKHSPQRLTRLCDLLIHTPVTALPADERESLTFQRRYAESVGTLLGSNIGVLMQDSEERVVALVRLLLNMLEQPSRRLAGDLLKDWLKVLREKGTEKKPWMQEVCSALLKHYTVKGVRFLWEDDVPVEAVDEMDFDDISSYNDFKGVYNSQTKQLADEIGKRFPETSAAFLGSATSHLIASSASISPPGAADDTAVQNAMVIRQWDALFLTFDVLFRSICEGKGSATRGSDGLGQVLQSLMFWDIQSKGNPLLYDILASIRAKALQYAAPFISCPTAKGALAQTLEILSATLLHDTSTSHTTQRKKSSAHAIAQICNAGREAIVQTPGMCDAVVRSLVGLLGSGLESVSMDAKASLRESLVSLSESVSDPAKKGILLGSALTDVVQHLSLVQEPIFSSPSALIAASSSDNGAALTKTNAMLEALLSCSKRVSNPTLPTAVWCQGAQPTQEDLAKTCHFYHVWLEVLPLVLSISRTLHGAWAMDVRKALGEHSRNLFSPSAAEIRNASKRGHDSKKQSTSTALESGKAHLGLLRLLIYQIFGVCCAQKALYVHHLHKSFVQHLFEVAVTMENTHLSGFLVHFLEPYLLHCPAYFHGEVAAALNGLLPAIVYRLGVAWSLTVGYVDPLEQLVFKHCSLDPAISPGYPEDIDAEGKEAAKDYFVRDLTRKFADMLASLGICRGILMPPVVPGGGAALGSDSNTGLGRKQSPKDGAGRKASSPDRLPQLDEDTGEMAWRREAMLELVTADRPSCATAEFLKAVLALVSFPDSYTCRKGIALSHMLLERCPSHRNLVPIVATEIFRAALLVLVQREKWLTGLEWEVAELLQDVYCQMVLGLREMSDRQKPRQSVDTAPRSILLDIGAPAAEVDALETQLRGVLSKKKRRDYFKDFVNNGLRKNSRVQASLRATIGIAEPEKEQGDDVEEHGNVAKSVVNIRQRPIRPHQAKPQETVFDSSALFG